MDFPSWRSGIKSYGYSIIPLPSLSLSLSLQSSVFNKSLFCIVPNWTQNWATARNTRGNLYIQGGQIINALIQAKSDN